MSANKSVSNSDRNNMMSTCRATVMTEESDVSESDRETVSGFYPWFSLPHTFLVVLLLLTIAVTFRGILHCSEERVMVDMIERIFDRRRGMR